MTLSEMSLEFNNLRRLQFVTNTLLNHRQYQLYLHCKVDEGTVAMQAKMTKQIRAIKKYAHSLGIFNLDMAALRWVESGCAAKWATQN